MAISSETRSACLALVAKIGARLTKGTQTHTTFRGVYAKIRDGGDPVGHLLAIVPHTAFDARREVEQMIVRARVEAELDDAADVELAPVPVPAAPVLPAAAAALANHTVEVAHQGVERRVGRGRYVVGQDIESARIRSLERVVKITGEAVYCFTYDIPDACDFANPSHRLWQVAARFNKSCWYILQSGVDHPDFQALLAEMAAHPEIETTLSRWHPDEEAKMRERARRKLADMVVAAHATLLGRIDAAARGLDEAMDALGEVPDRSKMTEAQKARDTAVRTAIREAKDDLDLACKCALRFDDTDALNELLTALRSALRSQVTAFNAAAGARGLKKIAMPAA